MNDHNALGYRRFIEAIRSGEDLYKILTQLSATRTTQVGGELFAGAIACLLDTYHSLCEASYKPTNEDRELQEFLVGGRARVAVDISRGLNGGDLHQLAKRLSALVDVVSALRGKLTWRQPEPALPAKPEPLDVRVVAMPDRVTSTTIHRAAESMEVTGSTQIQVDGRGAP
jgi:hypothetical protein